MSGIFCGHEVLPYPPLKLPHHCLASQISLKLPSNFHGYQKGPVHGQNWRLLTNLRPVTFISIHCYVTCVYLDKNWKPQEVQEQNM